MNWMYLFIVGVGGFFGAIARYTISGKMNNSGKAIPMGTLLANLAGAFLLGLLMGAGVDALLLLLLGTGFLGAFTTFSTLKLEMGSLWRKGNRREFLFYTVLTYVFGIALAFLGTICGALFL
ncbi:fluoride efflux transporter FluC [Oceanobacillus alkalisoli]|uniref:fluoride efflux transporter FluC n=1 Tax=Oceanobacillus alkalisoli TaxID=2925113 RepID=UPI0028735861|nr:CrcB family protein [Oceanobacillus alkalisoli]